MDWQTIIVMLAVLAALAFVGRRGWLRLRAVVNSEAQNSSSCASSCGGCGSPASIAEKKAVYQIPRSPQNLREDGSRRSS